MEQMRINKEAIVQVELEGPAALLKPVVFAEGDSFCCILGHDPQTGVFGCGDNPQSAVTDWNMRLRERLERPEAEDDYIFDYVKQTIGDQPMSQSTKDFMAQFRPVRR